MAGIHPTDILTMLNSNIFTHIYKNKGTHYQSSVNCNLLLLKTLDDDNNPHYAIQEPDGIIRIPSGVEVKNLEKILLLYGTNICNHDIGGPYLKESFLQSKISFVLFSKNVSHYRRSHSSSRSRGNVINVCGLLFLNMINRRNQTKDIYIKLVCAEQKTESERIGLGTKFLTLTENIGRILGCKKTLLSAVDSALGFYLAKGFSLITGSELYEIPEGIKIPIFRRGQLLQSNLKHKALVLDSMGVTTTITDATRLLPPETLTPHRHEAGTKYLGDFNIGALQNVKLDVDGGSKMVMMEKPIIYDAAVA